jgi:hypothetical protein
MMFLRVVKTAVLLLIPFIVLYWIGLERRNGPLVAAGLALCASLIGLCAIGFVFLRRSATAIGRHFGIKVTWIEMPLFQDRAFDRWKGRRGIEVM